MMVKRFEKLVAVFGLVALMAGCAAPTKNIDYSAFKASKPRSILVLPPLNESPDVDATHGVLAQVTQPLAEAGYYVMPVALVDETFRQNGLTVPADIFNVQAAKLHDIFGADAALYITVKDYGTKYMVLDSATVVSATARLVDLRSGAELWVGEARATSKEIANASGGGLIGALVIAAVRQIVESTNDTGFKVAGITSTRLLSAGQPGGLLYGPRSPKYGTD